ncbi:MAG: O-antigen ligase family protein [Opitutales bacterium]
MREKLIAGTAALTLAYTAWGFAGVIAWSLHTMLAGGLLTLLLALWPAGEGRRASGALARIPRILRCPQFYAIFAFLGYLALAALNPAWEIASNDEGWWLAPVEPPLADWLPTSVQSSYEPMNPWRIFNMHLAAFSLALGLKLGLKRRRSLLFVLWAFLISSVLMAGVAIFQKYSGAAQVLWTYDSENPSFWGSFFYRNQGVAFLNWTVVIAGVLYFYHAGRSRLEGRSGGPHFLAFCLIAPLVVSVGLALSRGGILFAAILTVAFLLLVCIDYAVHTLAQTSRHTLPITLFLTLALASLLGLGLFQAYRAIDWEAVEQRFGDIDATIENADRDARVLSSKMTWEMARDQLWMGWGAGSFRYAFPMYQKREPALFYARYHPKRGWSGRKFYRYAHNDLLQFLAEYGVVGSSLLVVALLSFLSPLWSAVRSHSLALLFFGVGLTCVFAHAFFEFIFHSPAYWVAFIGGLTLVSRLLQLEARRG